MGADAAAGLQVRAQRPLAFDALEIDVVQVVEHADVARLVQVVDQVLQHGPDRRALVLGAQRGKRQPRLRGPTRIALAGGMAHDEPGLLQLAQHAMHGLPGQVQARGQVGQADGLGLVADGFEHRQRLLQCRQPLIVFIDGNGINS